MKAMGTPISHTADKSKNRQANVSPPLLSIPTILTVAIALKGKKKANTIRHNFTFSITLSETL